MVEVYAVTKAAFDVVLDYFVDVDKKGPSCGAARDIDNVYSETG